MKKFTLIIFLFLCSFEGFSICDTAYYNNGQILWVRCDNQLIELYNTESEELLKDKDLFYTFFDHEFQMERVINVKDSILTEDFYVSKDDTLYNEFAFDNEFANQVKRFLLYLDVTVDYPKEARKKKVEKTVKVSFCVDKKGRIYNVKALTNHGYRLEQEAIERISTYQNWGMIIYKKKAVALHLVLPVKFKLE